MRRNYWTLLSPLPLFKMSWSRCCLENSKCGTRFNSSDLWFWCNWVAEGARLCGPTRIISVDINSDKFEIGKQFGITEFVNSKSCGDKPVSQVIIEMTNGGADYCFECVGLATLVLEAFACCKCSNDLFCLDQRVVFCV
ncbi:alcohol dehydrogenase-like 7 [Lycium barbarum]|uniref:alcohol dehydrogenase-like 7 n=1 Tax=Lycium barbarum TaxID=112863 RepID=UPI00293E23DC|nr:alcohol dehydrogenase-like 7 [Lycium barbarum]